VNKLNFKIMFIASKKLNKRIVFVLIAIFAVVAFLTAADGLYNQATDKLAEATNNIIVLPKVPERKFNLGLDLQGGTQLVYEADVSNIPERERSSSLEGVRDVIERRVNATGVSEPLIQVNRTLTGDYRIIAELAGVSDIDEAIEMIGDTPILEFKEQDDEALTVQLDESNTQAQQETLEKANNLLEKALENNSLQNLEEGDLLEAVWINQEEYPVIYEALVNLEDNKVYPELIVDNDSYQIIELLDQRMSGNPFLDNEEQEAEPEYLVNILNISSNFELPALDLDEGWKNTELTGQHLKRAVLQFNPNDGTPEVSLEFNSEGSKLFAEITKRNIGLPVAIFLDGYPISVPTVNEEIPDGKAVISGQFNVQEARLLVQRLNTGALPVPIELIGQQTVGASLGEKSISNSFSAAIYGFLFVALFMLFFYRLPGLISIISLLVYVLAVITIFKVMPVLLALFFILLLIILFILVFSELKIFDGLPSIILFFIVTAFLIFYAINPVTLTLAGLTGFILSIGMAVDANILIFERMKEELRSGKNLSTAIDEGFRRAWPSIRDGNITTILVCFVLMTFGTGLVKGFGATLFIGVSISMFSSIVITRALLRLLNNTKLEKYKWLLGARVKS
jgi:preprotein translocase subunit SecD